MALELMGADEVESGKPQRGRRVSGKQQVYKCYVECHIQKTGPVNMEYRTCHLPGRRLKAVALSLQL
jgi:hypothetical protein